MTGTEIDLERFFEQDMVEFLDRKRALQNTGSVDNNSLSDPSEMIDALAKNNVALASKLLENTIDKYNHLSSADVYKEIYFNRILELTRLISEFIRLNPQPSKLKEDLELLHQSRQLDQGPIDKITVFESRHEAREEKLKLQRDRELTFREHLEDKLKIINKNLFLSIRKKDVPTSIKYYEEMKICFEQYPPSFAERKKELYNDLLAYFMQLQKLRKDVVEDAKRHEEDTKRLLASVKDNAQKYLRANEIEGIINKIKIDVKNSDFNAARAKIIELKHIASSIPDEYKHVRSILNAKIDIINQRVEFVKRLKEKGAQAPVTQGQVMQHG
ncbi:hypothetical protein COV13_01165 [Candidatus Woesearchaeota archaeon CG10_big_fil_rev_8_21_14_0_10_32_9]|nr:MAG: hypothetical protein COV13_01165 [Candidatus Woesearchaeota archaeon CG10_big_fil_rev_8_21_14_0_10_32_9]